jgi:hypothetical protein
MLELFLGNDKYADRIQLTINKTYHFVTTSRLRNIDLIPIGYAYLA